MAKNIDLEVIKEEIDSGENLIQNLIDLTGQLVPDGGFNDFNEFAMLMGLSEENFDILSPIIVDKFEASFKDASSKYLLLKALEQNQVDIHQLIDYQEALYEEIDKELTTIPQEKRDFLKQIIGIIINAASEAYGNVEDTVTIPIEICREGAVIPQYANIGDAGLDVVALEDRTINPGETELVKTGLKVAIPKGYELQVRPRSGLSLKTKLRVANSPGTVDAGYRGEVGVIIENVEPPIKDIEVEYKDDDPTPIMKSILFGKPYFIEKGQKIAQLVLSKIPTAQFYQVESVANIGENRGGGFGSTDKK